MKNYNEIKQVLELTKIKDPIFDHEVLDTVVYDGEEYPITGFTIGSKDPKAPCFGIFGGVHGLEMVGAQVTLTYIRYILNQLKWDKHLRKSFENFRLVSIPIINPYGICNLRRSNGNGVDLMRNSPTDAMEKSHFLVSGHRISPMIPWYRGKKDAGLEKENQVLIDFLKKNVFDSKVSITLDLHSGFGLKDRLWYPYSKTKEPCSKDPQIQELAKVLDEVTPHHIYQFEKQTDSYLINGDIWDHAYDLHEAHNPHNIFIPLTLEMGSWTWVKKNPLQLFSILGLFNPVKPHRHNRTMRRHLPLLDLLRRITRSDYLKLEKTQIEKSENEKITQEESV